MPYQQVKGGIKLYYEWHGDHAGVPVVFIRGTGGDGSRWMPQVNAYVERYRCLIFDNRGAGRSAAPPGPYTMELLAGDALALLDALDVQRAHLSGLSTGGAIAQVLTLDAPSRVATLQLHGSWARTSGYALVSLSLLKRFLEVGGTDLYYEAAQLLQFPPAFFIDHHEEGAGMLRRLKAHPASPMGLLGQLEANLQHDVAARLGEIKVPTLITVGELDMCLPPHYSRELHRGIRGSELVIFPGGSHLVGMQDPAEFNRVTLDWLNRQVPAEA